MKKIEVEELYNIKYYYLHSIFIYNFENFLKLV